MGFSISTAQDLAKETVLWQNSGGVAPKNTAICTSNAAFLCVYANIRKYDVQNETKFLQMGLTNVSKFLHCIVKCAENRSFDWKNSTSELRTSLLSHINIEKFGCSSHLDHFEFYKYIVL